jgi:NMD protein affecting ribosome stability and mRNA decay
MSGKGLIRSLNRRGTRADSRPPVAQKNPAPPESSICERCGAVYVRRTWRPGSIRSLAATAKARWTVCPACKQLGRGEGYGRVVAQGRFVVDNIDPIRRRIANVAARAARTQPERKIISVELSGETLEVLATSQKLAHRITHELRKAFGGKTTYSWADDGALHAVWTRGRQK